MLPRTERRLLAARNPMTDLAINFDDVAAAAQRLGGHARRTPVLTSRTVDERTGV